MIKLPPGEDPLRPSEKPPAPKVPQPVFARTHRDAVIAREAHAGNVLIHLKDLLPRIDEEWHRRKLKSRSETIRVLLGEALK